MTKVDSIPSFGAMLRRALGDAVDAGAGEDFLAMCAEDVVFQFPYAPAEGVREVRGRPALTAYLAKAATMLSFESMSAPTTHPSTDGETFTLEFSCKGIGTETRVRYDQTYVSVVRVRGGKIVHYRDYWNPSILLDAVGGTEQLRAHLEELVNA